MGIRQQKNIYRKVSMVSGEYAAVNKLYTCTIFVILVVSLLGITGYSDDYIFGLMVSQLCMAIPAIVYLISMKTRPFRRMGFGKVRILPLAASVIMGFSIIPFISMINSMSMLLVKNVTVSRVSAAAEEYPLWVMLIMVALLPALVEEILYRGIYFGVYRNAGVIKGALLAAVLFAFMHGNLNQFAYAIVAGFLFAMIDYAGGSVVYSIIMHFIINGTTVLSLYADRLNVDFISRISEETEYTSIGSVLGDLWMPALVGLAITALGYMIIKKFGVALEEVEGNMGVNSNINSNDAMIKDNKAGVGDKVLDVYLVTGLVIMLINIIGNELM